MNTDSVVNSIERVIRYLVPGFILVALLRVAFPSAKTPLLSTGNEVEFAVGVLCLGLMVYGIHRLVFWVSVDHILSKLGIFPESKGRKHYTETIAHFILRRHPCADTPCVRYRHYRWAIVHYCLILAEIAFVLSFVNEPHSILTIHHWRVVLCASALWGIAIVHYVQMLQAGTIACDNCDRNSQQGLGM